MHMIIMAIDKRTKEVFVEIINSYNELHELVGNIKEHYVNMVRI